jgi:YesN/AraC family two-component response regulator
VFTYVICDDHQYTRQSLALTVRNSGLPLELVGQAQTGLEAEALIRRLRPHLVLTDIRMPGSDGLEVAARVSPDLPDTHFVVITGFQEFEYARRALRAGVDDLITKPVRDEELIRVLTALCASLAGTGEEAAGRLVDAIMAYLQAHFREPLSLDSVGAVFQVHASHVSRLVSQETGETFVKTVNRLRLEEARRLLRDPRVRIKDVVSLCGFHDYGHFLELYRKQFGTSPSERA